MKIDKLKTVVNDEQLSELKRYLGLFENGEIFNPYNLSFEIFGNAKKEEILNELVEQGKIQKIYIVVCPGCLDYSREFYTDLEKIKKNYMCRRCEYDFEKDISDSELEKHLQIKYMII